MNLNLTIILSRHLKRYLKIVILSLTIEADDTDTTDYLLSNSVNKERLLKFVENVEKRTNLANVDLESLKALANA